jgi:hypothetical protein
LEAKIADAKKYPHEDFPPKGASGAEMIEIWEKEIVEIKRDKRILKENWSKKHYPGLTTEQHKANNLWFINTLNRLKEDGFVTVPNIKKSFNKQGKEIKIIEGSESPKEIE